MPVSEYGAQQWAGALVGLGTLPAHFYVALCTDEPGEGWDGTVLATVEPQLSATYQRQGLRTGVDWVSSDGGYVINTFELDFPIPDIDWGNLSHFALADAVTDGNLWAFGELIDAVEAIAGGVVRLGVGAVQLGLSNLLPSIAE